MPADDPQAAPDAIPAKPPRAAPRKLLSRPLARGLVVVALVLALGAALAPWTVSRGALREEIGAQFRGALGLHVFASGRSTFSFLPRPHVRLEKIAFVDPAGALVIDAESLTGYVRVLPLLAGRLEVAEAHLDHPRVEMDLDGRPMTRDGAAARAAEARPQTAEAARADHARLGVVSFVDGQAELRRGGKVEERLSNINATLDWRIVAAPAALRGEALWRDRKIELSAWAQRPQDLLRGESSVVTVQVKTPDFEAAMNGPLAFGARSRFEGRLVASIRSTSETFAFAGVQAPNLLGRGAAALDGECVIGDGGVSLLNAQASFGQNKFEGALALRFDGPRPTLSGTLATRSFSGLSALSDVPGLIGSDRHFSREIWDVRPSGGLDLDLRLSAKEARFGRLVATDVAASVLQAEGRFDISVAEARFYKGSLKARVAASNTAEGPPEMKATLSARGIDWGALDWDQFGDARLTGAADLSLSLRSAGLSADQFARNAAGQGDLRLEDGELIGLDIERILRRMQRQPLSTAGDLRSGRTPFKSARAAFVVEGGVLKLMDGEIDAPNWRMNVAGDAALPERAVNLRAEVVAKTPEPTAQGFAFDIDGLWDNMRLQPDVQSFIRRSGAAKSLMPRARAKEKEEEKAREDEAPAAASPQNSGAAAMPPAAPAPDGPARN